MKPDIRNQNSFHNHPSQRWEALTFFQKAYYRVRAIFVWLVSSLHFFPLCSLLVLLSLVVDPRKNDKPQRWLFRNILRVAGLKFAVEYAPGFDRKRTSLFVCNHINLFDAFVIYSAIPQFVRGLELESHFKIPAYGWMMKRFGNVPVPEDPTPADYKKMVKMTKATLDSGVSLIVFAEGTRTLDGRVGEFKDGVFRMAVQFGYPIVPMSITGSYEFNRKGDWKLFPSKITAYLHDTIETAGLRKEDIDNLKNRVHALVAAPVDAHMGINEESEIA